VFTCVDPIYRVMSAVSLYQDTIDLQRFNQTYNQGMSDDLLVSARFDVIVM